MVSVDLNVLYGGVCSFEDCVVNFVHVTLNAIGRGKRFSVCRIQENAKVLVSVSPLESTSKFALALPPAEGPSISHKL